MLKLTRYCLMVLFAVQAEGSLWSELDAAWNDIGNDLDNEIVISSLSYPRLPNSLRLGPDKFAIVNGACNSLYNCIDCNTVQICQPTRNGTYVPLLNSTCPKSSPYCVLSSGTCSSTPDPVCGTPDQFVCPSNGYFPDATNCSIYHACNDYQSNTFICGSRIYDPNSHSCVNNIQCQTANCTGKSGIKVPLGTTNFFSYCVAGLPVIVDRCVGDYKLNNTSQECEPICTQNGLMTDYVDCTKYYKCSTIYIAPGYLILQRQHLSCQTGYVYDPRSIMCMPASDTLCTNHTNGQ